jgi:hypothetical protein
MPLLRTRLLRSRARRPLRSACLSIELLEGRLTPSVDVLTFHNDLARTGDNLAETQLTPANVNTSSFGQLFSYPVDGQVYAQPLIKTNVPIVGLGIHDVVLVATENDGVYAFDAGSASVANTGPLWHDSFANTAAGITAVPSQATNSADINPQIGITSTPVIDPGTNTLFVLTKTQEVRVDGTHFVQKLHALDLGSGAEKFGGPALLGDTTVGGPDGGYTDRTQIAVPGKGEGSDGQTVRFNALRENDRTGLILSGGVVYMTFASHGDVSPYHGWVVGYSATTLQLVSLSNDTPNGRDGGIWMSGAAPAVDASGALYLATGNGTFDINKGGPDDGMTIEKLGPTPKSNGQLPVLDYFAPHDEASLSSSDLDQGSGGVLLLPDQPGAHPHLLIQGGKNGRVYVLNRDSLGGFNSSTDNVVQALNGVITSSFDAPAYFNNGSQQFVYFAGPNDSLKSFALTGGLLSTQPVVATSQTFGYPGSTPSISASGTLGGIVWILDNSLRGAGPAVLHAYDATTLKELYNSSQLGADQLGTAVKFTVPTVANGKVYVGTGTGLYIFGLLTEDAAGDGGFESPAVGSGGFAYNPGGAPWTFQKSAGLTGNGSAFTAGNPSAPEGSQVAFLQGQGSASQTFMLPTGTFDISFSAAQRATIQQGGQTFQVLLDGSVISTFNTLAGAGYTPLVTATFTVSRGNHTLVFQGSDLRGGDNTVFIDQVAVNAVSVPPADSGFESPVLATGTYQYNPPSLAWSFQGFAGLAANGSAFTAGNPGAPEGNQVVFLQQFGSVSQSVPFPAGTYAITISAAQRANFQASAQTFQVLVDGAVVGTFNNLTGAGYTTLTTSSFTLAGGSHVVTVQGTDLHGGDNTVFIDQLAINALPAGLNDAAFESPALPSAAFQYNPTGSPWTFTGSAGVACNGSAFTAGNPNAPEGSQAAFLQGTGNASQTCNLPPGTFIISFSAAQRGNFQASAQTFQVLLDGNMIAICNNLTGTSYSAMTTSPFTIAAGNHQLTFQGTDLNGGDNTVFLDQVGVNPLTSLSDAGFETPEVAKGSFQYDPAGGPWTYTGFAGVAFNSSGFTAANAAAPEGTQVAFVQQQGGISQGIMFPAGTFAVTFRAAQRGNFQTSGQTFRVLLDGSVIATFNNLAGTSYTPLTTSSLTVSAGSHVLTFQGTDLHGGDNTVLIDQVAITPLAAGLTDSAFESPALQIGVYQYNPPGSPWTFTGSAGLASNGSAFTSANPNAPEDSQVAFLQGVGSVSQNVTFAAGTFVISFSAAQRANFQASMQTFQVLVDGSVVGTFNNLTGTSYTSLNTAPFTVAAGKHLVTFQATDLAGGDNTVLLDQLIVNSL